MTMINTLNESVARLDKKLDSEKDWNAQEKTANYKKNEWIVFWFLFSQMKFFIIIITYYSSNFESTSQ